jgi:hypothetical protein
MTVSASPLDSNCSEALSKFEQELSKSYNKWQFLRRHNRNWDGGLTIATILLTLTTTTVGVQGLKLDDQTRKLVIGLCGGAVVAIQSIGNVFPVKQRAGGYRLLQGQAHTLRSRTEYLRLQSVEDIRSALPGMREEYYKLLSEESKLET